MEHVVRVEPGDPVRLADIATGETGGLSKDEAKKENKKLGKELQELQELLYAASETPVLIVLQGRDTGGKDGTIKNLLRFINVQSTDVVGFKQPTELELAHDFLWRIHRHTPREGQMTIFNRSHYEDVLVARVHGLVEEEVWRRRYDQINDFERMLAESGVLIMKFYLHISKQEQKERLLAREQDSTKYWKLSVGDWQERERWEQYTEAYEEALSRCSTNHAPWYVVPADHKWYRNLAVTRCVVESLKPLREQWMESLSQEGKKALAEISAYRQARGEEAA